MTPEHLKSMKQLLSDLKSAEHELRRPHEDVVVYSVCFTIRQSVSSMMTLYLLTRGARSVSSNSLAELYEQCCKYDKDFLSVKFNDIFCRNEEMKTCRDKFCSSVQTVSGCLNSAIQMKELLQKKLSLNEN